MADVVVFGAGSITDVIVTYLEKFSEHRIVGFTVDEEFKTSDSFRDRPLVAWTELERHFAPDRVRLLGPVSFRRLNQFRRERYLQGKARGYSFASFIDPRSDILTDDIGENCVILERNVIQPYAKIGNNVVIWSSNHIAHHVTIADHCFITSHVGIAGASTIGEGCFLAGKAGVSDNVTVGDGCLVGLGAIVHSSVPANSLVFDPRPTVRASTPSRLQELL